MKDKKIKALELKKFDGIANMVNFPKIKEELFNCKRIDLIPNEKIVKLNIPWGELYCRCSEKEWGELYKILDENHIKASRPFLDSHM